MHDATVLEEMGLPTAAIVTEAFLDEARSQVVALGMERLEPVVIEHPLSTLTMEEIHARARHAAPGVRKALWGDNE